MNKYLPYYLAISILLLVGIVVYFVRPFNTSDRRKHQLQLYQRECGNCHGEKGDGLKSLYPPLHDTTFLSPRRLTCIISYGIKDTIIVSGKLFHGEMVGIPDLTTSQVADIVNFVRAELNGLPADITKEDVRSWQDSCISNH